MCVYVYECVYVCVYVSVCGRAFVFVRACFRARSSMYENLVLT